MCDCSRSNQMPSTNQKTEIASYFLLTSFLFPRYPLIRVRPDPDRKIPLKSVAIKLFFFLASRIHSMLTRSRSYISFIFS